MSLVPSLLQAIVRVDGEALVMHAGDKPYVVSPTGQVDLASRGLTLEAVNGIVSQLLPIELQNALEEFGAVQHELAPMAEFPGEHFTIVAARGGDDVWAEIRRRRIPEDDRVPDEFFSSAHAAAHAADAVATSHVAPPQAVSQPEDDELPVEMLGFDSPASDDVAPVHDAAPPQPAEEVIELDDDLLLPDAGHLWPGQMSPAAVRPAASVPPPIEAVDADLDAAYDIDVEPEPAPVPMRPAAQVRTPPVVPVVVAPAPAPVVFVPPPRSVAPPTPIAAPRKAPPIAASVEPPRVAPIAASIEPAKVAASIEPNPPAVVLNISRNPIRSEMPPPPVGDPTLSGLERLLRVSSARGASTLYLSSESRPSVRVDGELQMLDGEPVHVARDVESLLLTLMPERSHEALRTGAATEWICDLEGVGRVRCMSFRDQRGPGGVFRLMPTRSVSADQLGLPKHIQALAIEPEGIILVAGPRSSGKRTTMSAFVDLMNRTRRDHIITIEREINIQHERGHSFISQREVRGGDDEVLLAARAAMREDPDVLVIEEIRTGALMNVALEAAAAGRLVVGGFTAHTATGAIDRIIDLYAPEYHRQVQMALADSMRGVIAQVLLRKVGGGRLPAREVLLNTPAVSGAIAEGKTSQLPMAIEGGRRYGMMPLNDALVGLVQNGSVEAREAYRHSPDRPGFLAALNRQGIDTTFVERLANG
jgi:twitching motility protein PilT